MHANPDMFLALHRWLATGRAPQRQSLLRLAQYLARSAAKTSPYSTFTSSGLAAWGTSDDIVEPSARLTEHQGTAPTGTEVSIGTLHRIARAVGERPDVAGGCPIRINPSATVVGDTLVFLGRRPVEHVHGLALTPTLRRVLDVTTHGTTPDELRGALLARAADGHQADAFLRRLVTLGVLEPVPPLADQSPDPVADLRSWLHRLRRQACRSWTGPCTRCRRRCRPTRPSPRPQPGSPSATPWSAAWTPPCARRVTTPTCTTPSWPRSSPGTASTRTPSTRAPPPCWTWNAGSPCWTTWTPCAPCSA
ncbi:lantibiotic dehydratase [Kitasatospora arboriphila]